MGIIGRLRLIVSMIFVLPLSADIGREVLAGKGSASGDDLGGCALEDDLTAVVAGAGAEVDDPVGVRHDRLVMLDRLVDSDTIRDAIKAVGEDTQVTGEGQQS
jgi:hypothetical protein